MTGGIGMLEEPHGENSYRPFDESGGYDFCTTAIPNVSRSIDKLPEPPLARIPAVKAALP